MPARVSTDIEVRYAETDQMGVVHHAAYLVWFELARTRLCLMTGQSYAEIEASGFLLMVIGCELRYRRPCRYGDTVRVECWIERLSGLGLRFGYEVWRGDELATTGTTEHLWVKSETGRPARAPEALRQGFARLAEASA